MYQWVASWPGYCFSSQTNRKLAKAESILKRTYSTLLVAGMLAAPLAYAVPTYSITDLGLGTGLGINNAGQVTGVSNSGRAYIYSNGVTTNLGTLGGDTSYGLSINNLGQITGYSYLSGNNTAHAFVYSNGVMTDISNGIDNSAGMGINDSGQVAIKSPNHSFLYSNGAITDLGSLGGTGAEAHAINNAGQVTGISNITYGGANHAFLFSNGAMTDVETLGGTASFGYGINDAGQITGDSNSRAFIYSNGAMTLIGNLGGGASYGYDINNLGQVTGSAYTANHSLNAFLFSDGVMTNLNTLIDPQSGWELQSGKGINDSGQITGIGYLNGSIHAYILTPVPEPEVYTMFAVGLALLGWAHRKSSV